jgi:hypothetical protein
MDWFTSIPGWPLFYIFLAAIFGFLFPFIIGIASLPILVGFGAIMVGCAYFFAEAILEWFVDIAKDTFRKRDKDNPKQEPITPYAHVKVAAFALSCAIATPISLYN